jgi:hypothetical protein
MLIECKHCGAPLDVKPNQRLTKCAYCGTTSQVKANRTVAFETPPDFRPPKQWTPPVHAAADSGKTLVYHAANAVRRLVSIVVTLAIVGALVPAAIAFYSVQQANPDVQSTLRAAEVAIEKARAQAETLKQTVEAPAAPKENFFEGRAAVDLVSKFEAKLGADPLQGTRLVLYLDYATLEARDPTKPTHVDRYLYRDGTIGEPDPVNVQSLRGKLDDHMVSFDQVALDKIPDLIRSTVSQLGYEAAEPSHVIIERNLPFTKNVVIRVYVSGARESGRIDYTAEGKVQRVFK